MRAGRFRPMTAQKLDVGLDAGGKIVGWRHRLAAEPVAPYLYGQARLDADKGVDLIVIFGADVPFYDVPAHVAEHIYEDRGARVAAWRGIGAGYTNLAVEAMIDELARDDRKGSAGIPARVAEGPARQESRRAGGRACGLEPQARRRRALGIAFSKLGLPPIGFSMSGTVAEISARSREPARSRCTISGALPMSACRCSPATSPRRSRARSVFSLGAALKERITIKDGQVEQSNFHDYETIRMSEVPEIKVEVLRSGDIPLPVGELGIGGTAPAVANAFLRLTGKPLRDLPFTPDRVKAALA